jgi:hypothetical protein
MRVRTREYTDTYMTAVYIQTYRVYMTAYTTVGCMSVKLVLVVGESKRVGA